MQAYSISAEQFRRQLADVLNRVSYGGEKVIVERHGSPQAVLIPYLTYQQFEELIEQNSEQLSVCKKITSRSVDRPKVAGKWYSST